MQANQSTSQAGERTQNFEVKGRAYDKVRYGLHSRRINGDGTWYGLTNYKTEQEAREALTKAGQPLRAGFITVNVAGGREAFEYRIVREESKCEVLHVENKMV